MNSNSGTVKWEEKELEKISFAEGVSVKKLKQLLGAGRVVIPKNAKRAEKRAITLKAIGTGMSMKVNVNVGTSKDYVSVKEEVRKAKVAIEYGADAIMDLSTGGDLNETRRTIVKEVDVPVGRSRYIKRL
jgi:phosphomethylpyrimidine synthase